MEKRFIGALHTVEHGVEILTITILPEIAMARTKWQHARRRVTAVVNINNTFRRSHSNHVRCNYIIDFMVFASVLSNLLKSLLVGPRH